jgi:hypothetical protein
MQSCAQYVKYQFPTEHTRVGYLLEGIQCNDAGLQAAMASVKLDTTPVTGKRNDFEAALPHLLPYDPVAKTWSTTNSKRGAGDISTTTGAEISSFGAKKGIGSSGGHLRWHTSAEYNDLSSDQAEELREWWKTDPVSQAYQKKAKGKRHARKQTDRKGSKNNKFEHVKHEKAMAAAIEKGVDKRLAEIGKQSEESADPTQEEQRAYIMSLLQEDTKPSPVARTITLKSILHKAKNRGWLGPSVQLFTVSSSPSKRRENALETESRMWDPGGPMNKRETNSCKINENLERYIATAMISDTNGDEYSETSMRNE